MEEKDEYGISYDEIIATLSKYITTHNEVINQASSPSYPTNYPLMDIDDLTKLVNGKYSQGIANGLAAAGTTTTIQYSNPKKEKENEKHTLTQDKGYFVYWLMMHFAFLEDQGFKSKYSNISRNVSTGWGRTLLNSGTYNNTDKAFLQEVSEWMRENHWVYKKPVLNEHNDTLPLIQRLPIEAIKL